MTKIQAERYLYELWEQGEVPANFTVEHTEYNVILKQVMVNGYFNHEEYLF